MAKKKKTKKAAKKATKKVIKKKVKKPAKKIVKAKAPKEKLLGRVEHFFDKISVAAISVKAPFKVGDVIHIKGHTTDFAQRIASMQMEHQDVQKVKKGDDIGIKVKDFVRQHDFVYLSDDKALTAVKPSQTVQPVKAKVVQQPMFPILQTPKSVTAAPAKPVQAMPTPAKPVQPQPKADPYENKKFFNF
jgi:hypothetical protein